MLRGITTVLAWAWMIIVGVLLITPGGVICIACGVTPNVPGYIGTVAVTLIALVSIIIGVLGFVSRTQGAGRG